MRDYGRSLELAAALIGGTAGGDYRTLVATRLNECFRGTVTMFFDGPRMTAVVPDEVASLSWEEFHRECGSSHPLEQAHVLDGPPVPVAVSDVLTDLAWRENPSYRSAHRELDGSIRQLAIPAPGPGGANTGFLVCRSGRDFTPQEREFADRVYPLIGTIFTHMAEVGRLRHRVPGPAPADPGLTPRELTVLHLSAEGHTAAAVARRLGISTHTVNKHLENSYRKCGTRDRLTTVLLVRELGLVPPGH